MYCSGWTFSCCLVSTRRWSSFCAPFRPIWSNTDSFWLLLFAINSWLSQRRVFLAMYCSGLLFGCCLVCTWRWSSFCARFDQSAAALTHFGFFSPQQQLTIERLLNRCSLSYLLLWLDGWLLFSKYETLEQFLPSFCAHFDRSGATLTHFGCFFLLVTAYYWKTIKKACCLSYLLLWLDGWLFSKYETFCRVSAPVSTDLAQHWLVLTAASC